MPVSLKKHLHSLSHDELVEEILKLTKKFKDVKAHYDMDLGDTQQQAAILESHKQKLKKQFFPTRGYGNPKASEVRKIISEFKKISVFPYDTIDLLLYRVEMAVAFTQAYGDIDEAYYSSTEKAYEDALKLIKANSFEEHFQKRCLLIQHSTSHFGWGFADEIESLTEEYFSGNE